jgi:hypothetical protein
MKVEKSSGAVESTMTGEKIAMGIAIEDMSHIMGILAGLYKDRLLAIVREYSCNAWDAHVEAGIALPVEISLPSSLYPTLRIRDYGCGMSAEDIRVTYSQYGRSTKRNTNSQVGMMGLGCKSALSYTNQFTVVSVKDGNRTTVLIALDEEGIGSMQILAEDTCDDANGTEVQVAIRREDIYRCSAVASDFFKYWDADAVLIDGQPPKRFEGLKLNDGLYLIEDDPSASRIVMGNVAYPYEIDVRNGKRGYGDPRIALVAFVPIGSVKPTPSRESLMDVQITKDCVARIRADYRNSITGVVQREVDAAASPIGAIQTITKWAKFVPDHAKALTYTYKGTTIPEFFRPTPPASPQPGNYSRHLETTKHDTRYGKKSDVTWSETLPIGQWPTSVWVEGFTPATFTTPHKNKLRQWAESNNICPERYVLLREDSAPNSIFIDKKMVVAWDTIKAIKLASVQSHAYGGPARIPGSYDIYTEAGLAVGTKGSDIRQDEPLFWKQGNRRDCKIVAEALTAMYPKFTLVCLGENRVAKFVRDVKVVKTWSEGCQAGYKAWCATVHTDDLKALALRDKGLTSMYRTLSNRRTAINDPAIRAAIEIAQRDINTLLTTRQVFRHVIDFDLHGNAPHPLKNYPLAQSYNIDNDDMIFYLNAKYAQGLTKPAVTV